jgi:hypothetical protein
MNDDATDLDGAPLRFNPPDGWRTPHPQWILLHQGFLPPGNWQPYEDAPSIPPQWPWWEENGTSWYTFFRDRAALPARALGNWFSLAALGLFATVISPFALSGWTIGLGGGVGIGFLVLGVRGVVRTYKRGSAPAVNPHELIREWAQRRLDTYVTTEYAAASERGDQHKTLEEFVSAKNAAWWSENASDATNW